MTLKYMENLKNSNKFLKYLAAAVLIAGGLFFAAPSDASANLIANPSFETVSASGLPESWSQGGYGSNTAVFVYPDQNAYIGQNAATVEITQYFDGDAKWYFDPVAVTPGTYQFSDHYRSDISTYLVARYTSPTGAFSYFDLATLQPSAGWTNASVSFTVPSDAAQMTIFHLISGKGYLSIDDLSLTAYVLPELPQPPAPTASNLILNPSFEYADGTGMPTGWFQGNWGFNQSSFAYPAQGYDGGKAAKVEIFSYSDGDAKWYFSPISAKANYRYVFSDYYQSSAQSVVEAYIKMTDNTGQYIRLGTLPAAENWTKFTANFSVPANASSIIVYHFIETVGWLTVDEYVLAENGNAGLAKGMVSLDFDDGWLSAYKLGLPIFNNAGFKTTQNIFTNGFNDPANYVTVNQVKIMQSRGNEIGCHSASHADLAAITDPAVLANEIGGARAILASKGIQTNTFAYPYGSYNSTVQAAVKSAGFASARSSDTGYNTKDANKYALMIQSVENTTTISQVKAWINSAKKNKTWLILLFHEVATNTSGRQYSVTPNMLKQIAAYLKTQQVPVVTNSQGIELLGQ